MYGFFWASDLLHPSTKEIVTMSLSASVYFASLEEDRLHGDQPVDSVVNDLSNSYGSELLSHIYQALSAGKKPADIDLSQYPLEVRKQVLHLFEKTSQLPLWANPKKIKLAQHVFSIYGPEMIQVVLCGSLPYLLCAMRATNERLPTDGIFGLQPSSAYWYPYELQFYVELLTENGISGIEDTQLIALQRRRFGRSCYRHYVSAGSTGSGNRLGVTKIYNQEDLVAEVLAFGIKVLTGLEAAGIKLNEHEKEAYLHFWNVIGYSSGVRQILLPVSAQNAMGLLEDVFYHQADRSEHAMEAFGCGIKFLEHLVYGNRFSNLASCLVHGFGGRELSKVLENQLSEEQVINLAHKFDLNAAELNPLIPGSFELRHLSNLFSREIVEGLSEYYLPYNHQKFSLPLERLRFWRSFRYSSKISGLMDGDNLQESLKAMEDMLHFQLQQKDSSIYSSAAFLAFLQQVEASLQQQKFLDLYFVNRVLTLLVRKNLEVMDAYINSIEPPFAWKLVVDAHLAGSYYPDQYLSSWNIVQLLYDFIPQFSRVANERPLEEYKREYLLLMKFYQRLLPQVTKTHLQNPTGERIRLKPILLKKLKKYLEPLEPENLWLQLLEFHKKISTDSLQSIRQLESLSLEFSQIILHPAGLYNSVLKTYSKKSPPAEVLMSEFIRKKLSQD